MFDPASGCLDVEAERIPVCVVIPNFGYGHFLESCIESIVRQTHPVLDIAIYDDGSRDGSAAIASDLLSKHRPRFRHASVTYDPRNNGKLYALNRIMASVDAPLVSIVDADDMLMPEFFSRTVAAIASKRRENPAVSFCYTDCTLIDEAGRQICRGSSHEFDAAALKTISYIPDCAPVLTSAIQHILPFDTSIRTGTKHHKWIRLVEMGCAGTYIPEPLFYYRMHSANLSGIGERIKTDMRSGARQERILSKYWGLQSQT